jgi:hypothetical protein
MSDASRRLDAVRRIQAVQAQKHRLEEWRLADLRRREGEARAASEALIRAMDGEHPLHGLFVAAGARRLEALSAQEQRLAAERVAQAAAALEQARRLKASEKILAAAQAAYDEERRRLDLVEVLERAGDRGASPA